MNNKRLTNAKKIEGYMAFPDENSTDSISRNNSSAYKANFCFSTTPEGAIMLAHGDVRAIRKVTGSNVQVDDDVSRDICVCRSESLIIGNRLSREEALACFLRIHNPLHLSGIIDQYQMTEKELDSIKGHVQRQQLDRHQPFNYKKALAKSISAKW